MVVVKRHMTTIGFLVSNGMSPLYIIE